MKIFGTDTRDIFYVAQENIDPIVDTYDSFTCVKTTFNKLIKNKLLGEYFKGYDPLTGEYLPKKKYQFMFPDPHPSSDSSPDVGTHRQLASSSSHVDEEGIVHEALIRIFHAYREPLLQSHEAAKASSVYALPTNDFLKRFGGFYPSINGQHLTHSDVVFSSFCHSPLSRHVFHDPRRTLFSNHHDLSPSSLSTTPSPLSILSPLPPSKLFIPC
jgi:hypothetical protein